MTLYGHAIPLDGGGYAVTVICPNHGSYVRLMTEVGRIEADAFAPAIALADGHPATGGGESSNTAMFDTTATVAPELPPAVEALIESQDDEPPFRNPDAPVGDREHNPQAYASATAGMAEQGD